MSLVIDGQIMEIKADDKNIVDVADRAKIGIIAACYRDQASNGCCHGCIVDIDSKLKFACATVPADGMNVIIDRADLNRIRKERLLKYQDGVKSGRSCGCDCSNSSGCCK